jgi:hypothetical protein
MREAFPLFIGFGLDFSELMEGSGITLSRSHPRLSKKPRSKCQFETFTYKSAVKDNLYG